MVNRGYSVCRVYWMSRLDTTNNPSAIAQANDPKTEAQVQAEDAYGGWLATEGHSDVLSCSWNKDTSNASGVFNIVVKSRKDYATLVQAGDLMMVYMSATKPTKMADMTLVTVGVVDRVSENVNATGEGATVASVTITGRDFGKILMDTETVFDPSFAFYENELFTELFHRKLTDQREALSPLENVLHILDLYLNEAATGNKITASQWRFPGRTDVSLTNLLNVQDFVQAPMFGYTADTIMTSQQGGNLWTTIESVSNRVVNEIFIDVRETSSSEIAFREYQEEVASSFTEAIDIARQRDLRTQVQNDFAKGSPQAFNINSVGDSSVVALVYRQMPYDNDSFYKLPVHRLDETQVKSTSFGHASHDVTNFLHMKFSSLPPDYQEFGYGIKVNESSIRSFGIKRLVGESMYAFLSSAFAESYNNGEQPANAAFNDVYDYYVGLLSVWNAYNEHLLAGSIQCIFLPHIRVGRRLEFTRMNPTTHRPERLDFYIQGVQHAFEENPGASRTSLTVVRGLRTPMIDVNTIDASAKALLRTQNLRWGKGGVKMPIVYNPWKRFTASNGFMSDGLLIQSAQTGL